MPWTISSKLQILFLSTIGVYRTIKEFYNQNLEEVWQLELSDNLSPYQNLITSALSGIILVREFTGHLYIACYILIMYPLIMGKMRSALLLWMLVSGLRSILLNLGVAIIGIILCSSRQEFNFSCFKFVGEEALELGCSIYMWTVVNNFYHSLKKVSIRSHYQSPIYSPNTSQIVEDTSSSFLSDEWSLPLSLVEEFQKNTKDNLLESTIKTTSDSVKNLKSRSVDSLLAQAMVDWFIKKIVKFKPKAENEDSTPANLTEMNSKDVSTLRKRIKKSIADIDKDDIKDLLASSSTVKSQSAPENTVDVKIQGTEEKVERVVNQENLEGHMLKDIPKGVTCRDTNRIIMRSGELTKMPDFIPNINGVTLTVNNCSIKNQSEQNNIENDTLVDSNLRHFKLPLEPSNAVNIVKQLFDDSLETTLESSKNNKSLVLTVSSNSINKEETFISCQDKLKNHHGRIKDVENSNSEMVENVSLDFKEKALDCSIVIVKSLLDDVVGNSTGNKEKILKKDIVYENVPDFNQVRTDSGKYEASNVLKPSKDSNAYLFDTNRMCHQRKISFVNDIKITPITDSGKSSPFKTSFASGFRNNFDDFPERVRSVLKSVNVENVSRRTDKVWKLKKPYNKENEYENRFNYKKKDKTNDQEMTIKALRHHFRRCNQTKVPIKRSKETILSQKSLKTIIEGFKTSDKQKLKTTETAGSSRVDSPKNMIFKICSPKLNRLKLKDTSAQTITTKKLLEKIREAEEEDDDITL